MTDEDRMSQNGDAMECEAEMMIGLQRLFGEAYLRGRARGRQDQFRDDTEKVEPTNEVHAFPDKLVERLELIVLDAKSKPCPVGESWARIAVRAVLSELAKTPVEMPHKDAIIKIAHSHNADLQKQLIEDVAKYHAQTTEALALMNAAFDERDNGAKRITELEKDAEEKQATAHAYIVSLEKRIAELTAPMIVDGKTPGQIDYESYASERAKLGLYLEAWSNVDPESKVCNEVGARAVLRAFGGESLRRVRRKFWEVEHQPISNSKGSFSMAPVLEFVAIVDDELAKLEGK